MASGRLTEENCLGQDRNLSYLVNTKKYIGYFNSYHEVFFLYFLRSIFYFLKSWAFPGTARSVNGIILLIEWITMNRKSPETENWWCHRSDPDDRSFVQFAGTRGACVTPEAGGGGHILVSGPGGDHHVVTTGDRGQTSDTASDPRYCPIWSGDTIASPVSVSTFLTINPFTKLYCPDNHLYTPESVSQSWPLSDPWQK